MKHHTSLFPRSEEKSLFRLAAVTACLPPMAIGLFTLWPLFNFISIGCLGNETITRCRNQLAYIDPELFWYPIGFTCLLFTPIVGWICYKYVICQVKGRDLTFGSLLAYASKTAITFHLFAATIHYTIYNIFFAGASVSQAFQLLFFAIMVHFIIIIFVTVPLTFLSVLIFRLLGLQKIESKQLKLS